MVLTMLTVTNFFTFSNASTRNSEFKLYKERTNTKYRENFLPHRINNLWNELPTNVRCAKNVNQFKNLIDKHLTHLKYECYE